MEKESVKNQSINRRRAAAARKRKKQRQMITLIALIALAAILMVTSIVLLGKAIKHSSSKDPQQTESLAPGETGESGETDENGEPVESGSEENPVISVRTNSYHVDPNTPANFQVEPKWESILEDTGDDLLNQANFLAAEYDYDRAIELLSSTEGYNANQAYQDAVAGYEEQKSLAVKWADNTQITHIFFHTLVVDVENAFTSYKTDAYNQVMTTVQEFIDCIESMYERGFVLVSLYDVAKMETQPDGTEKMVYQPIYLPEGKEPFVLSQDDVSYYEYMTGTGFANRFVIGDDGLITNEMELADGTVLRGSYDMVPILEDFIATHPDFCYRGARGTLAMTGYDGLFGYRTSDFWYREDCEYFNPTEKNVYQRTHEHTYPNLNIDQDKETAKMIANALKAQGWTFASHSWGHRRYGEIEIDALKWDADMWEREVEPILGDTDILIFPTGNDIGSWKGYEDDNERFAYLKACGFDYFCNVDSSQYWVQRHDNYLRQGRRNVDGTRMWQALNGKDLLSDLFDSKEVFDPIRPTPVP